MSLKITDDGIVDTRIQPVRGMAEEYIKIFLSILKKSAEPNTDARYLSRFNSLKKSFSITALMSSWVIKSPSALMIYISCPGKLRIALIISFITFTATSSAATPMSVFSPSKTVIERVMITSPVSEST
ncbi:hypothetical protein R84B8_01132 [Treponema sp. R8-4-B8]